METGFDTASSVALIAISMLAKRDSAGGTIGQGDVIILPVRFIFCLLALLVIRHSLMLPAFPPRALQMLRDAVPLHGGHVSY